MKAIKPLFSRLMVLSAILVLVMVAVIVRLNVMMGEKYEEYTAKAESKSTKTLSIAGMRGTIYDTNMVPLAYDRRSYNVTFYRDPSRRADGDRRTYTESIIEAIELIESNGKVTTDEFWLKKDENGTWRFDSGSSSEYVEKTRESQWRANFYMTSTDGGKLFDTLCEKYYIPADLDESMKVKVLAIWQASRMNAYNSMPVVIAYDVGFETVSEIEAQSTSLDGFGIVESSERIYPHGTTAAHVIGYTGKITSDTLLKDYVAKGYSQDAMVGVAGIEASMEDYLSPQPEYRRGERVVEIDTRGKVVREISYEAPMDGNSVVLTINLKLQEEMADALADTIAYINNMQQELIKTDRWKRNNKTLLAEYEENGTEIKTAETGAIIAFNPNNGQVLGMASHPTFDLSLFAGSIDLGSWSEIVNDSRNPLYNRAVATKDTPGSIFKMCTALAGLAEKKLTLTERITDRGAFTQTDSSKPSKCWTTDISKHADQTVVEGLKNSCNYFFYTIGNRLGSEKLTQWAAALGLTSRTNIELPGEATSFIGNQDMLYDADRAISNQYTSKPIFVAAMIKQSLQKIGENRNIEYDDDRLDEIVKLLLDLVTQYDQKSDWYTPIREILLYELNLPSDYIQSHYLVNTYVTYLQDLFWTPNETIMAAIGQSITQLTPIAVARYVAAIANGGTVYDAQIIDKIIAPDGTVVLDKSPVIANQIVTDPSYFAAIRQGMEDVTSAENEGTAAEKFKNTKYKIAAKTGTAQRTTMDVENNSWLVCYAPADDPKIVVVVYIQNGYAGLHSADAAIRTVNYYLDEVLNYSESTTVAQDNTLAD